LGDLAELFLVSEVRFHEGPAPAEAAAIRLGQLEVGVQVRKTAHARCPRCRRNHPTTGQDQRFPELCLRCAAVVASLEPAGS